MHANAKSIEKEAVAAPAIDMQIINDIENDDEVPAFSKREIDKFFSRINEYIYYVYTLNKVINLDKPAVNCVSRNCSLKFIFYF
jgi:hypothetical protein